MVKISAFIFFYSNEKNIDRCISSVSPVADEVIVVGSPRPTQRGNVQQICSDKNARFIEHSFNDENAAKNFVAEARYDYVLTLDADEYLSEELAQSIIALKQTKLDNIYEANRVSSFGNKQIRYSDWQPYKKIILWNRSTDLLSIVNSSTGNAKLLTGDLQHQAYTNVKETIRDIQQQAEKFAAKNVGKESSSAFKILIQSAFTFFKSYVLNKGVLDGFAGLMAAITESNMVFYNYAVLYEKTLLHKIGKRIVISRTDNLGDVILTLPLLSFLKTLIPDLEIYFIGKKYTKAIIDQCVYVNQFLDREEVIGNHSLLTALNADTIFFIYPDKELAKIAKAAKIKRRVATAHRWYHWVYCNRLVFFSRVRSQLHESQLNFKLLIPFKYGKEFELNTLSSMYGLQPSPRDYTVLLSLHQFNLIIHPKSKGSAREWPLHNYLKLIESLPSSDYKIFVTGLKEEGELIRKEKPELLDHPNVTDLTGKLSLKELTSFISKADGLIACSTGVLHLAAALGKFTLGIYAPMRPIHPGRWMPVGKNADYLVLNKECRDCVNSTVCQCINSISAESVKEKIENYRANQMSKKAITEQ